MKILGCLTINGDTILNGLVKVISTLFLEAVGWNLYLRTASDKSVGGLTAIQLRDELNVYNKAPGEKHPSRQSDMGHKCDQRLFGAAWRRS
jgi:hypothetical protein